MRNRVPKNGMYTTNYAYIHQEYKIFKGESNVNKDREKEIIKILLAEEQVTVAYLADKLYASRPSIRRDLANLEKMQLIHRTHGGAVLNNSSMADSKIPFILRELEHGTAKSKMGRAAAEQSIPFCIDVVFKTNVFKINRAVRNRCYRVFGVVECRGFVKNLDYTLCRLCRHGNHNIYHRQHHKRHKNLNAIGEHCRNLPYIYA